VNLLVYSHDFAPSVGGVETIVLALARGLAELKERFDLTLVTQTTAQEGWDDRSLPFKVVRKPSLRRLWGLIRRADVVHLAGPALVPLLLGLVSRKPVVIDHHGFQAICPNGQFFIEERSASCPGYFMAGRHLSCLRCNSRHGWLKSLKLWGATFLRRFLCKRAAANLVPTKWLGGLLDLPRTEFLPHGLFSGGVPERISPSGGAPLVICQGRLVSTKGVRVLLEAAAILHREERDFRVEIIGSGPERASLEDDTRRLGLTGKVRFLGRLPDGELDTRLSQADIVVAPSLSGEVFGLAVAENMLRGIPLIISDLEPFVEVAGNCAVTFRAGDAGDLASCLRRLLEDPILRKSLGERGRARILQDYSLTAMIRGHARSYEALSAPSGVEAKPNTTKGDNTRR
jgi:glycosyltransferase involved in cell wall biosynthesis